MDNDLTTGHQIFHPFLSVVQHILHLFSRGNPIKSWPIDKKERKNYDIEIWARAEFLINAFPLFSIAPKVPQIRMVAERHEGLCTTRVIHGRLAGLLSRVWRTHNRLRKLQRPQNRKGAILPFIIQGQEQDV